MRTVVMTAAVAAIAVAAGGPVHSQRRAPNVLLVTLDTVRADHIGAYGYTKGATPTLDRLAREGVRFADATTQAPLTGPAHAAILTGSYPARFGVRDNASTPLPAAATTMAEVFKAHGYRTGGFVGAFILDGEYGFAQGFDRFDAAYDRFNVNDKLKARRSGREVTDAALSWLGEKKDAPFFAWVHLYDAHSPYEAPAPYSTRFRSAPYDGAISYVDACVGRIVAALEKDGTLDNTIVAVLADHGESLGEHGESEHGIFLYEPVLHIPWLLRLPGRAHAGTVVDEQVRAIDVLPTIADLAGVPVPRVDGESVVPEIDGRKRQDPPPSYAETFYPKLHYGWSELKSVRVGEWKYIDAPRAELYDVVKDRAERQNLLDSRGTLAGGLSNELNRIESGFGAAANAEAPQPDPATLARLRSLGYVGVTAPNSGGRGADPKDKIETAEAFRVGMGRALTALQHGDSATAIPILEKLTAGNDRSYELHLFLGDAYTNTKQDRKALDQYKAAANLNPVTATPLVAAARVYLKQGDYADATTMLDHAERLEPGTAEVAVARGIMQRQLGDAAGARREFEAAIRANPSDPQPRANLAPLALQTGDLATAKREFTALLKLGYLPARMHFGLGEVAEAAHDRATAAAEYRRALRLEPSFALAKAALARVAPKSGT